MKAELFALLAASFQSAPDTDASATTPWALRPVVYESHVDPVDDSVSASVSLRGERGARLSVGCDPREYRGVRVMLAADGWLQESWYTARRTVRYRFDAGKPRKAWWETGDGIAYERSPKHVARWIGWMMQSERLALRTRDIEGREIEIVFPLAGLRPELDRMLTACNADRLRARAIGAVSS
ncbi:MAG TPA: hypothetical protein VGB62_04210 [Allosphingosinicella sp.]|jgi:hypothetical protein